MLPPSGKLSLPGCWFENEDYPNKGKWDPHEATTDEIPEVKLFGSKVIKHQSVLIKAAHNCDKTDISFLLLSHILF